MNKMITIQKAVEYIKDHSILGIGGNTLHRAPMALVREVVRQDKKSLRVVKTAGAHDVDLLVRGGCVESVDAGFISYETEFGLASYFRKACQAGTIRMNEHACYTVMSALNAARINAPFMPVFGLKYGDLIQANDYFAFLKDPFSGEEITVVKAIEPDVSIIHVTECDENGNCVIDGPMYDDVLLAKASQKVIISTEKIISTSQLRIRQNDIRLSGVLVDHIVVVKRGALPCAHGKKYDIDRNVLKEFLSDTSKEGLDKYLTAYEKVDHVSTRGV